MRRPAVKKINTDRVESAYPTIVQSGGRYNLKANAGASVLGSWVGARHLFQLSLFLIPSRMALTQDPSTDHKILVAEADEEPLHYGTEESPGVMIVSLGARYKGYCANISRTFLVNPTEVRTCARMPPTAP